MHSSWFVEFQRDLRTSLFRTVQVRKAFEGSVVVKQLPPALLMLPLACIPALDHRPDHRCAQP